MSRLRNWNYCVIVAMPIPPRSSSSTILWPERLSQKLAIGRSRRRSSQKISDGRAEPRTEVRSLAPAEPRTGCGRVAILSDPSGPANKATSLTFTRSTAGFHGCASVKEKGQKQPGHDWIPSTDDLSSFSSTHSPRKRNRAVLRRHARFSVATILLLKLICTMLSESRHSHS